MQQSLINEKDTYDAVGEYQFVIYSTWATLIVYTFIFFIFKAWFSLSIILVGAIIIMPICVFFANKSDPLFFRILFIASINFYILGGSLGGNNFLGADYFFFPNAINCIILFRSKHKLISAILILFTGVCWMILQLEAKLLIPESFIVYDMPKALIKTLSFYGSLALMVSYLIIHAKTLEKSHLKSQQATLSLNQQKEKALELLTKIANNLPGAVYQFRMTSDGKSSFPYSSHGIKKIYRLTSEQVQESAEEAFKVIHPDDLEQLSSSIQLSAKNLSPWNCDYRVKFDNEEVEWRRGVAMPQKESDDSILWHGFITDITNEKQLESDLQQSQAVAIHNSRLASLGEMAGGIAHEINNPLSIVSSKAALIKLMLETENPPLDRAQAELDKLIQTTFRIAGIVKGLLTFSRGDTDHQFQNILVEDVMNDVSLLCGEKAKAKGINLQFQADKTIAIHGNSVQIVQVILNLINNSIDAIDSQNDPWINVQAKKIKEDLIRFSVTDCGLGIPLQQVQKLMQPFFTTKGIGKGTGLGLSISKGLIDTTKGIGKGTGLGLSISKGLIEMHGGTLTYDTKSHNTQFYFDLKIVELPPTPHQSA